MGRLPPFTGFFRAEGLIFASRGLSTGRSERASFRVSNRVLVIAKRLLLCLSGALVGAALMAALEAGAALRAEPTGADLFTIALCIAGVLAPLAASVGFSVWALGVFLEPNQPSRVGDLLARLRHQPMWSRAHSAAALPLAIVAAAAWCTALAHGARHLLASGSPKQVGASLALLAVVLVFVFGMVGLSLLAPLRRLLATFATRNERWIDPAWTGLFAALFVACALVWGMVHGTTGGEGGALEIFGVLRRPELDLRPLVNLGVIALSSYGASAFFATRRSQPWRLALLAVLVLGSGSLSVTVARALNAAPSAAFVIERGAPLGKIALAALRKVTDRDHDGVSPLYGGGDCDDRDPRRSPLAIDIPGNGIDEDCSGEDLTVAMPQAKASAPRVEVKSRAPAKNLILITVDTLRAELGFLGYPKPVSPALDRLAERGVVFERAYAFASYTGRSLAPLLIGKYPSETLRDGSHFATYAPANTLLAERLKKAGFRTMGAASHWYFAPWSGMAQGIEQWDLSARPPTSQGDSDATVTSDKLSDVALKLLKKEENTADRFFMWLHYFDPHAQYVPHDGAPDLGGKGSGLAAQRALYDGEIWFTDKHIGRVLDYVASQPWGKDTAIIVTADHGEAFAEHGMSWHGVAIWEPLVRVPLIIVAPNVEPHRVPVKRSHIDVVPTALDLLGLELPGAGELSGQSMMADLGDKAGPYEERDVYLDMPIGPHTGLRRGLISGPSPGFKLIQVAGRDHQLFDLASDPGELHDLSSQRDKLAEMKAKMAALRGRLKEIEVKADERPNP